MKKNILLYFAEDCAAFDTHTLSHLLTHISELELVRYNAFRFEKDKRLFLISHAMMRLVLSEITNTNPHNLIFEFNEFGKPSLTHFPEISFNLSHSHSVAVLAIGQNPHISIGVDVEHRSKNAEFIGLIQRFFAPTEIMQFIHKNRHEQNQLFYGLWTLKEAYLKALGIGLSLDLNKFAFNLSGPLLGMSHCNAEENKIRWFFGQIAFHNSYLAAVAVRNNFDLINESQVTCYDWHPDLKNQKKDVKITSFVK